MNIERDTIPDRIGTVLWWLIMFVGVVLTVVTWKDIWHALLPMGGCSIVAFGFYHLITGRTD